jgi:hypothetical protein
MRIYILSLEAPAWCLADYGGAEPFKACQRSAVPSGGAEPVMMISVTTHGIYFGHSMPPTLPKTPKMNIYTNLSEKNIYIKIYRKYIYFEISEKNYKNY